MRLLKAEQLFRKVIEDRSKRKGRLLGLDVGSKYVGLAVSDEENKIALPLSVVGRTKTNISLMADDFKTLVSKYSLVGFVVGYPFNLRGQACPDVKCSCVGIAHHIFSLMIHNFFSMKQALQVKLLVGEFCKTGKLDDLSYTYWDENFTSKVIVFYFPVIF
ncbi:hypothetical protein GUJ93_ZPchr0007g5830 [Zizania palustris]|uniref:YqgF/RNase H-like domain-containing protein n=1 Tax=Zizania palustris TaxID=103762 RepID=A0A8J5T8F2_ZIZPA|nr:hypothetical protein GUJ93_ZPchr0007g5830 [Zizania palustris]